MINIGIGVSWAKALYSVANNIIANFRARVLSYPNSIFEAGPCLDATLEELNAIGLLDNASLIVTPNAYNEGVLYDVIPNTPLGDMDVVRATTATRVNSAGLIEVVPRNLLTYSNNFTNAVWGNGGYGNIATVIANDIISPDGLMNGSKITFSAGVTQGRLIQQTSVINGGIYEASIFVKYGNKNTIQFYCDAAVIGLFATFNFTTKVLTGSGVSNTIVTELPNGWFRLQYTYTAPSATSQIGFISNVGEDGFIYAYGGQAEIGSTATEYFPTTTRLNIPRIDYTNGSCPSLLVEPQRTNTFTYSSLFNNWIKQNASITDNSIISPDGNLNAGKFIANSVNTFHAIYNSAGVYTGTYTFSVYAKKGEYDFLILQDQFSSVFYNTFNLSTGAIVGGSNSTIKSVGNGWYRCTVTFTAAAVNVFPTITISPNTTASYLGNSVNGGYLYGAQMEIGTYATSLIPTVASSVTRNADVISKTGISSLIGQTEGTIFADIDYDANIGGTKIITGLASSGSSFIYSFISGTTLVLSVYNSGILQCYLTYALPSSGKYKIAIGYKLNDFIVYVNGANVVSQTSGTVPTCSIIYVGNDFLTVLNKLNYNSVQLYKTRLTDEQCILLTGDLYNSYAEMANSLNYILE